jgi:hypothetical protein
VDEDVGAVDVGAVDVGAVDVDVGAVDQRIRRGSLVGGALLVVHSLIDGRRRKIIRSKKSTTTQLE